MTRKRSYVRRRAKRSKSRRRKQKVSRRTRKVSRGPSVRRKKSVRRTKSIRRKKSVRRKRVISKQRGGDNLEEAVKMVLDDQVSTLPRGAWDSLDERGKKRVVREVASLFNEVLESAGAEPETRSEPEPEPETRSEPGPEPEPEPNRETSAEVHDCLEYLQHLTIREVLREIGVTLTLPNERAAGEGPGTVTVSFERPLNPVVEDFEAQINKFIADAPRYDSGQRHWISDNFLRTIIHFASQRADDEKRLWWTFITAVIKEITGESSDSSSATVAQKKMQGKRQMRMRQRKLKAALEEQADHLGRVDYQMPKGTRIFVAGRGRGSYVRLQNQPLFGANKHTIAFDSGETVAVKLKKGKWTVRETEMDAMDAMYPPAADIKP